MFSPPVYITIGDEYDKRPAHDPNSDPNNKPKPFVVSAKKHAHITDSLLNSGYAALAGGDAYDIAARRRSAEERKAAGVVQPPFRPSGVTHKSAGKGDYYGTFMEQTPYKHEPEFPPIERKGKSDESGPKRHTNRLIYTNPAKKGTYGFTGLTIQKKGEIQYISDPYEGNKRREALESKANNSKQMGAPFRAAVRSGGCFDESEHGFPKVYSLTKPLPLKKQADSTLRQPMAAKPWVPGGALAKDITQYPEYIEDPEDEKERKVQEMRRAERDYKPWKPAGNDPYRYIYTKPIQYNPPPVK